MSREWSEEGLNFEAEVSIKDLQKFGIQKIIDQSASMTDEDQEENDDE